MFKFYTKDTIKTSITYFWCLYYYVRAYFTLFSIVSIVDYEQVNVVWVYLFAGYICIFACYFPHVTKNYLKLSLVDKYLFKSTGQQERY